jgi:hypothetical protein
MHHSRQHAKYDGKRGRDTPHLRGRNHLPRVDTQPAGDDTFDRANARVSIFHPLLRSGPRQFATLVRRLGCPAPQVTPIVRAGVLTLA